MSAKRPQRQQEQEQQAISSEQDLPQTGKMRFQVGPLGEFDEDALFEEMFLANTTMSQIAKTLLGEAIAARQQYRDERMSYIAAKRGMSLKDFRALLHRNRAEA